MDTTKIMIDSLRAIRRECDTLWHMIDNEDIKEDIICLNVDAFEIIRKLKDLEK